MSEKQFIHFRLIQTPYCEKAPVPLALRPVWVTSEHFIFSEMN